MSRPPFFKDDDGTSAQRTSAPRDGLNFWTIAGFVGLLAALFGGGLAVGVPALAAIAYGTSQSAKSARRSQRMLAHDKATRWADAPIDVQLHVLTDKQPGERPLQGAKCGPAKRAVLTPRTPRKIALRDRASQFCESAAMAALLTTPRCHRLSRAGAPRRRG